MLACQDPTERAVSPVVGVMLMLVVTIIIAAIVTAFAGGITQTGDKTPQATLTGQFSHRLRSRNGSQRRRYPYDDKSPGHCP